MFHNFLTFIHQFEMNFEPLPEKSDNESSKNTKSLQPNLGVIVQQSYMDSSSNSTEINSTDTNLHSTSLNSTATPISHKHPPLWEIPASTAEDKPNTKSDAEIEYIQSYMSLAKLCTLSIGLVETDGSPLFDPTAQPWCSVKNKKSVRPLVGMIVAEIKRCGKKIYSDEKEIPKSTYWDKTKKIKWLQDNPTKCPKEVAFLQKEILQMKNCLLQSIAKKAKLQKELQSKLNWRSSGPCHLRLMHALVENKEKYIKQDSPLSRTQLDARNSIEHADSSVWVDTANTYNNPSFNPQSMISECHSDYNVSHDLSFLAVEPYHPATVEMVKERVTAYRTGAIRVVTDWEASGQGNGGCLGDEIGFGDLKTRPTAALETRAAFLRGLPSHVLYMWELFESEGMLSCTLS